MGRCLREYTAQDLQNRFAELGPAQIEELRRFPYIFAYESRLGLDPHFGLIKDVTHRQHGIRVDYELHPLEGFISANDLETMAFELDIGKWELYRTHWALKDVDLAAELSRKGFLLPRWASRAGRRVNLNTHHFDVSLSFPGEAREYVEEVAKCLEQLLGPDRYFYDRNYTAQLARPGLDIFLQSIYGERSKLIVVFAGRDYQAKDWCGIEFRAVREIIGRRENDRVMIVRMDEGDVEGLFSHDGFVDARNHYPVDIAKFIAERVELR